MKLSDIKALWPKIRMKVIVAGMILAVAALGTLFVYVSSPSTTAVPKADKAQQEANVLIQKANESEGNANVIHVQKVEQDKRIATSKQKVTETQKHYEEVRNAPVRIDNSNLDDRERELRSKLSNLYPANR